MMPAMKTCNRCGENKPMQRCFYRHRQMADGHLNICTDCVREQRRAYREQHGDRLRYKDRQRGFHNTDTVKQRARRKVAHAISRGALTPQPCEVCGVGGAEAHHDDYEKPLSVRWMCKMHHSILHREYA